MLWNVAGPWVRALLRVATVMWARVVLLNAAGPWERALLWATTVLWARDVLWVAVILRDVALFWTAALRFYLLKLVCELIYLFCQLSS